MGGASRNRRTGSPPTQARCTQSGHAWQRYRMPTTLGNRQHVAAPPMSGRVGSRRPGSLRRRSSPSEHPSRRHRHEAHVEGAGLPPQRTHDSSAAVLLGQRRPYLHKCVFCAECPGGGDVIARSTRSLPTDPGAEINLLYQRSDRPFPLPIRRRPRRHRRDQMTKPGRRARSHRSSRARRRPGQWTG